MTEVKVLRFIVVAAAITAGLLGTAVAVIVTLLSDAKDLAFRAQFVCVGHQPSRDCDIMAIAGKYKAADSSTEMFSTWVVTGLAGGVILSAAIAAAALYILLANRTSRRP